MHATKSTCRRRCRFACRFVRRHRFCTGSGTTITCKPCGRSISDICQHPSGYTPEEFSSSSYPPATARIHTLGLQEIIACYRSPGLPAAFWSRLFCDARPGKAARGGYPVAIERRRVIHQNREDSTQNLDTALTDDEFDARARGIVGFVMSSVGGDNEDADGVEPNSASSDTEGGGFRSRGRATAFERVLLVNKSGLSTCRRIGSLAVGGPDRPSIYKLF